MVSGPPHHLVGARREHRPGQPHAALFTSSPPGPRRRVDRRTARPRWTPVHRTRRPHPPPAAATTSLADAATPAPHRPDRRRRHTTTRPRPHRPLRRLTACQRTPFRPSATPRRGSAWVGPEPGLPHASVRNRDIRLPRPSAIRSTSRCVRRSASTYNLRHALTGLPFAVLRGDAQTSDTTSQSPDPSIGPPALGEDPAGLLIASIPDRHWGRSASVLTPVLLGACYGRDGHEGSPDIGRF
ncbi:MAG: hypothetical protein AVDCRST_MAG76-1581, partial [uncultured Acidimicrobiales bacterium]